MIFAYDFSVITDSSYNRPPLESLVISLIAESRAMPESPQVGARVPADWQQQIQEIAFSPGRKEAEVVREAIA